MRVSVLMNNTSFAKDVSNAIEQALETSKCLKVSLLGWDGIGGWYFEKEKIKEIDICIVDFSENSNLLYNTEQIIHSGKGIIPICSKGNSIPNKLTKLQSIIYDRNRLVDTLTTPLNHFLSNYDMNFFKIENFEKENKIIKPVKQKPSKIFVSYSHRDTHYLNRLKIHLKPFERKGLIDLWSDEKILTGQKWQKEIENALNGSAVAILLISADFLASDFIAKNELPSILSEAESEGKLILPIIVKPCMFLKNEELSKFQAVNDPRKPLSSMEEHYQEEVFVQLADIIENLISIERKRKL